MEASDFPSNNLNVIKKDVLDMFSSTLQPGIVPLETLEDIIPSESVESECLTSKTAVEFLLDGTLKKKVCRYCLNVTSRLSELDQILEVAGQGVLYKVTIRDMVASFHPFKVAEDPNFPNKICEKCLDRTLSSYLFTQQCERSERALRNYFEDIFEKIQKLDPLEKQKKRGRTKLKINHNIITVAHEKVIDYAEPLITIINTATETMSQVDNTNSLICMKCCQKLPNLASLLNHEKSHPMSMWYHCHVCGKSFPKRLQLKKHFQSSHVIGKSIEIQKTDFKCLDCGTVSAEYHTHLQHIEKHKFQEVMEHLVNRKMDKLCSVCLNKGSKLVELEKMVCLHGGYPEIMGDHTVYNILGLTVPEKSSYKYRELLIPSRAKILSILKLQKIEDSTLNNKTVVEKDEEVISLNETSVLDNQEEDILSETINRSESLSDNGCLVVHKGILEEDLIEEDLLLDYYSNNLSSASKKFSFVFSEPIYMHQSALNKFSFSFSEPINVVLNIDIKKNNVMATENTNDATNYCKTCWIFKKPNCDTCIGDNDVDIPIHKTDINIENKKCSACWIFQNCKRCGFCKKPIVNDTNTNSNISQEVVNFDVELETDRKLDQELNDDSPRDADIFFIDTDTNSFKETVKKQAIAEDTIPLQIDHSNALSKITKKRKCVDTTTNTKPKRLKWQCQICLTVNSQRELCICCDSPSTYNEIKYNFKFNNEFFNFVNNNIKERTVDSTNTETIANGTECKQEQIENVENNTDTEIKDDYETKLNFVEKLKETVDKNTTRFNNVAFTATTIADNCDPMTIDENEQQINLQPINTLSENMEITDNIQDSYDLKDSATVAPIFGFEMICSNTQEPLQQFQFNIGTARTTKKPARRIKKLSRK